MSITTFHEWPTPDGTQLPLVHVDMQALADAIDEDVPVVFATKAAMLAITPIVNLKALVAAERYKMYVHNGTVWVSESDMMHAEFTGSYGVTANTLWGTGPLTRDTGKAGPLGSLITSPGNDTIFLPEPGSYKIHARLKINGSVSGTVWASLRDANDPVTFNEYDSCDFITGTAANKITMPNLLVTNPAGQNVYLKFWSTQSGLTLTTRISIEKSGSL